MKSSSRSAQRSPASFASSCLASSRTANRASSPNRSGWSYRGRRAKKRNRPRTCGPPRWTALYCI
eukprot:4169734-Lingulodinium_polyedra.AAC.1